jgi:hypothetical protein
MVETPLIGAFNGLWNRMTSVLGSFEPRNLELALPVVDRPSGYLRSLRVFSRANAVVSSTRSPCSSVNEGYGLRSKHSERLVNLTTIDLDRRRACSKLPTDNPINNDARHATWP